MPLWAAVVVAIAGGLIYDLGFPGASIWPLAFVGIALALLSLIGRSSWAAALMGFAFGLAFYLQQVSWTALYLGPIPWLALSILESLFVAGGAVLIALGVPLGAAGDFVALGAPRRVSPPVAGLWSSARPPPGRSRTAGSRGGGPRSASPRAPSPTSSRGSGRPASGSSWSRSSPASSSGCDCADGATCAPRSRSCRSRWSPCVVPAWPTTATGELRVASVQGNGPSGYFDVPRTGRCARVAARRDRADPRRARNRCAALARGRLRHRPHPQRVGRAHLRLAQPSSSMRPSC